MLRHGDGPRGAGAQRRRARHRARRARSIRRRGHGRRHADVLGCPAIRVIEHDIVAALAARAASTGCECGPCTRRRGPPTGSSPRRERKLKAYGIAPPGRAARQGLVQLLRARPAPPCPYCDSPTPRRKASSDRPPASPSAGAALPSAVRGVQGDLGPASISHPLRQKRIRLKAVEHPMVDRERHVAHRAHLDRLLAIPLPRHRPALQLADAEDR